MHNPQPYIKENINIYPIYLLDIFHVLLKKDIIYP